METKVRIASGDSETPQQQHHSRSISKVRNVMSQCFAVLAFNIIKFSSGTCTGFTTLLLSELKKNDTEIVLSKADYSWFASYCFTGPVSAIAIGLLAQRLGSRVMLLIGALLFSIAWLMFYYARDAAMLLIAQSVVGINISIVLGPGVAFIVEITQASLRSTFMATTNLSMILGTFFTVLLSNWLHWRTISLVNLSFSVIGLVSVWLIPESPHWLASKGRLEEAERSLAWLRGWAGPEDVSSEFRLIRESQKRSIEQDQPVDRLTRERRLSDYFLPYLQRSFYLPLATVCLLFVVQALSGSHTVQAFSMRLFAQMDSPMDEHVATSIFDGLRIVGAVVCICTVHLLGRRKLLFFSLLVGGLACFGVALSVYLTRHGYVHDRLYLWLPPIFIILSTFAFASGMDKIVNMLNGELFPSRFRNVGAGIGSFISAVLSTLMLKFFTDLSELMTLQGIFLFFAIASGVGFFILYPVVPETEGHSLPEIEAHYNMVRSLKDCATIKRLPENGTNSDLYVP